MAILGLCFLDFVVDKPLGRRMVKGLRTGTHLSGYPSHAFGTSPFNRIFAAQLFAKFLDGSELLNDFGGALAIFLSERFDCIQVNVACTYHRRDLSYFAIPNI